MCKTYSCLTEYDEEEVMNSIRNESYNTGKQDGIDIGREHGIKQLVQFAKNMSASQEIACENLQKGYELSYEEAMNKVLLYWKE